jgi:hypothetical protein
MRVGDRRREFKTTVAGGSEHKHKHSAFSMERSSTLTPVAVLEGDVIARYYSVVDHLSKQIQAFHAEVVGEGYSEVYSFPLSLSPKMWLPTYYWNCTRQWKAFT